MVFTRSLETCNIGNRTGSTALHLAGISMSKIVNLSVHKNNKRQRDSKHYRSEGVRNFKQCISKPDVVGYAIATWDREGCVTTFAETSNLESPINYLTLPESLKTAFLDRLINS